MDELYRRTATIGAKTVWLPKPYNTPVEAETELVGRDDELRMIAAAWMTTGSQPPLSPLLYGTPGVGKNRLVYEIALRMGKDLYIVQGHEDFTAEDLACSVRFKDDGTTLEYTVSGLVAAMDQGQICFIDEIGKIRPRALALLVSVLDERRYIDSNLLGERVEAKPGFRFIAATNTADFEGRALPEFLLSRMHPSIEIGHPAREEIDRIVEQRFLEKQEAGREILERFWLEWKQTGIDLPPTPRDAIAVFCLATSHSAFERVARERGFGRGTRLPESGAADLRPQHVARAIRELKDDFGRG